MHTSAVLAVLLERNAIAVFAAAIAPVQQSQLPIYAASKSVSILQHVAVCGAADEQSRIRYPRNKPYVKTLMHADSSEAPSTAACPDFLKHDLLAQVGAAAAV